VSSGIRWTTPPSVIIEGIEAYEKRLPPAIAALLRYYAPQMESFAKAYAPWTDRTGNARQSLFTIVDDQKKKVVLYLSHGMEYGVYLELRWQGKYAIIMPTIGLFEGTVWDAVKRLME